MLPRFADIFQQGNRWLNWLEKQPDPSDNRKKRYRVRPLDAVLSEIGRSRQ